MNDKYQIEINEFIENFLEYKELNIVIYGIGRYTATLLAGVKGFQFVGLMDKNPENIGKKMFGLPIVDQAMAEKIADMVIINTSETYWDVIYKRIHEMCIPIFFKNGEQARKKEIILYENPFKMLSYKNLYLRIQEAECISFDFFDTLFMRSVCNPQDLFSILEKELKETHGDIISFVEVRNEAKRQIHKNYTIDELYLQIQRLSGISKSFCELLKEREKELEKEQLIPRGEMISVLKKVLKSGKKVYIISDMYLPEEFYRDLLMQFQIDIPQGHILLSNVLDKCKADGTMWNYYSGKIVHKKRALHIGDDLKADIKEAEKYSIKTYHIPNSWDLLAVSSMREIASYICGDYESAVMGNILKQVFNNPFALEGLDGKIRIKDNNEMGYCVFGPVILTFLLWLQGQSRIDSIRRLIFMSRDGYFLKEDYEYLCKLGGEKKDSCYLGISRQLAMIATIESYEELLEYAMMPYSGSISELFEDRFGITDVEEKEGKKLEDYIREYLPKIEEYIFDIRKDYLNYIKKMQLDDGCAVVDLGYYGNNQRYLNKLLKKQISGYYFNANLSKENYNSKYQKMIPCFQEREDYTGEKSQVLRRMIYLESFLTAPYGMVKAVDSSGNFICNSKKGNQRCFGDKVEINTGVKRFIYDYMTLFGNFKLQPNLGFIDWYYGYCFSGILEFSDEVKKSFYNDNAMMNRIESMIFY